MAKKKKVANEGKGANTHIAVVMDRSGSMGGIRDDTIGGFNTFLAEQKKINIPTTITYTQFDTEYDIVHENLDVQKMPDLDHNTYQPRGGTALLDAIGRTVNSVENDIESGKIKPDQVIFVIITDGYENSSREFTSSQIKDLTDKKMKKGDWDFVYLGANQDSFSVGGGMGMMKGSTRNWEANALGVQNMYADVSRSMMSSRLYGAQVGNYFEGNVDVDAADLADVTKSPEMKKDQKESA